MSSPLKGNKLYPDIPTPTSSLLLMPGVKRKGGEGIVEKENEKTEEETYTKKIKVDLLRRVMMFVYMCVCVSL